MSALGRGRRSVAVQQRLLVLREAGLKVFAESFTEPLFVVEILFAVFLPVLRKLLPGLDELDDALELLLGDHLRGQTVVDLVGLGFALGDETRELVDQAHPIAVVAIRRAHAEEGGAGEGLVEEHDVGQSLEVGQVQLVELRLDLLVRDLVVRRHPTGRRVLPEPLEGVFTGAQHAECLHVLVAQSSRAGLVLRRGGRGRGVDLVREVLGAEGVLSIQAGSGLLGEPGEVLLFSRRAAGRGACGLEGARSADLDGFGEPRGEQHAQFVDACLRRHELFRCAGRAHDLHVIGRGGFVVVVGGRIFLHFSVAAGEDCGQDGEEGGERQDDADRHRGIPFNKTLFGFSRSLDPASLVPKN